MKTSKLILKAEAIYNIFFLFLFRDSLATVSHDICSAISTVHLHWNCIENSNWRWFKFFMIRYLPFNFYDSGKFQWKSRGSIWKTVKRWLFELIGRQICSDNWIFFFFFLFLIIDWKLEGLRVFCKVDGSIERAVKH